MSENANIQEATAGRALTWKQRFAYSIGNFGVGLLPAVVGSWGMYYYAPKADDPVLKPYIPLAIVGYVLFFGRLGEALINPFIGHWSDKTKTRFGRRIPYILIGAPLMVAAFVAMWFLPVPHESYINAAYVGVLFTIVCVGFAAVVAPYLSLLPELTPYDNERVTVSSIMAVFEVLGSIVAAVGAAVIIERYKGGFCAEIGGMKLGCEGPTGLNGFQIVGVGVGVLTLICYLVTAFTVKEKPYSEAKEVKFSFWEGMRESFRNKAFTPYMVAVTALRLSLDTVIVVIPFIVTTVMNGTEETAGALQAGIVIFAIIMFPVVNWLSGKVGKKKVFFWGSFGFVVILPLTATIGSWPLFDPMTQGIILFTLAGLPVATISVLQRPLIADVIDADEKLTGYRREAMYNGMEGLFTRSASGLAWVVSSQLFILFGATKENPGGILLCGPVAGALLLFGLLYFRKYPIEK